MLCLAVGCERGWARNACRAFCEVSESQPASQPAREWWGSLLVVRQLRHPESAQEQAFQMTDWHIAGIIRGRHETNIPYHVACRLAVWF